MKKKQPGPMPSTPVAPRKHVLAASSVDAYLAQLGPTRFPDGAPEIFILEGDACRTLRTFHQTVARTMGFPAYYGENLAALSDCIFDFRLAKDASLILAIRNADALLREECRDYREGVLDTFEFIGQEWEVPMTNPVVRSPQMFVCLLM